MPTALKFRAFSKPWIPVVLWFGAAAIIPVLQYLRGSYNNYKIFTGVFHHTLQQTNLYAAYPAEYFDTNHYGPFFSVLIAPFALLPDVVGMVLWSLFITWMLYKAIQLLPIQPQQKIGILWISFIELTTAHHSLQTNPAIAGWIILAFVFVHTKKEHGAAFFALLGFFVKIYGIVSIVFGLFSQRKMRLAIFAIIAAMVLFLLPMALSSPQFVLQSYQDWWQSLAEKNVQNLFNDPRTNMQNISVMGMASRIWNKPDFHVLAVLVPAALAMVAPLLRVKQYRALKFQLHYLAAVLLSIVLFSTGSESPTFIIAVVGAAIYFVIQEKPWTGWQVFLLFFMLLLTCLSPTDIFPRFIRKELIQPFALKALPPFLIWLTLIYHLLTKKFFTGEAKQ